MGSKKPTTRLFAVEQVTDQMHLRSSFRVLIVFFAASMSCRARGGVSSVTLRLQCLMRLPECPRNGRKNLQLSVCGLCQGSKVAIGERNIWLRPIGGTGRVQPSRRASGALFGCNQVSSATLTGGLETKMPWWRLHKERHAGP